MPSLPALLAGGGLTLAWTRIGTPELPQRGAGAADAAARGGKAASASWLRIDANGRREQQCWWQLTFGPQRDEIQLEMGDWQERVLTFCARR